jgi:hypothetical protein
MPVVMQLCIAHAPVWRLTPCARMALTSEPEHDMIDPKEIFAACSDAHAYGQSAGGSMAQPFISSIPDLSTASSSNASNLIGNVQQVGGQMLNNMTKIKASIDSQVFTHQDAQQRQKTYDFKVNNPDLRPTDAVGFPQETPSVFFAPFKTGK